MRGSTPGRVLAGANATPLGATTSLQPDQIIDRSESEAAGIHAAQTGSEVSAEAHHMGQHIGQHLSTSGVHMLVHVNCEQMQS